MSQLKRLKVLIADFDPHLANVTKTMLTHMGFSEVHITSSGTKALDLIKAGGIDFLITDWSLKHMDGLTLLMHIRRDRDIPNRTLPVIMLTGRMEKSDVQMARDTGIHEYILKPFSAQAIYDRLERIFEVPRCFVVGQTFVGPDRRNRKMTGPLRERRSKSLPPQTKPWDTARALNTEKSQVWSPDFSLKQKLGNASLDSIITPALLKHAQASIDALSHESLQWIKEDLAHLKKLIHLMRSAADSADALDTITEVLLTISARSGTFGYPRATEIAYMLYAFFRNHFLFHSFDGTFDRVV